MALNLRVEAETSRHFRHANIVGWAQDKSKRRLEAIELARKASLQIYPPDRKAGKGLTLP